MSVSASISLRVVQYVEGLIPTPRIIVTPIQVIKMLVDYGWSLSSNGYVGYLPIGDKDDFDWQENQIDFEALMNIVKKKTEANEIVGVVATWANSLIGGEILLYTCEYMKEHKIYTNVSFCLSSERQTFLDENDHKITDVNWYLKRILPAFNRDDCYVASYTYEEDR